MRTVTLLALASLACSPNSMEPLDTPDLSGAIALLDACGQHAQPERIRWFQLHEQKTWSGGWGRPHAIALTARTMSPATADWYRDRVIAHELLHDILDTPDHPPIFAQCHVEAPDNSGRS